MRLHDAVDAAEQERGVYIVELRNDGYSLRQIASVLGVAPSTVMRWGPYGEESNGGLSLDDPAR